uniref:Selenoprotein O n=1 Tax=Nelumbo nucifera TaxID=4432 RepID=A0A822ZCF6_NELNU|nr:TPA_asm: hypothetical protein HUJ06_000443 [Nelumbo nucifera]
MYVYYCSRLLSSSHSCPFIPTIIHFPPCMHKLHKMYVCSGQCSLLTIFSNLSFMFSIELAWAVEVAERTASLVARWQGVGFIHGVLDTDNTSVLGLTIDYGPYGFLDAFDPSYTPNTTDLPGRRYCFGNQPDICLWNIKQFTATLSAAQMINDKEANYAMERYIWKF